MSYWVFRCRIKFCSKNKWNNKETKRPDSVIYIVYNFNDILNKIIPFFDKNSLLGVKQLDYQDFCKIANMIKEKEHLTEEGKLKIYKIKAGMNRGRKIN